MWGFGVIIAVVVKALVDIEEHKETRSTVITLQLSDKFD